MQMFRWPGTLSRIISGIQTLLQTTSSACWKRFCFQRTSAISALDVSRRCALQIYILLTYLLTCSNDEGPYWRHQSASRHDRWLAQEGHQEAPAQENHNAPTDALCRHHTNTAIRRWQRWQRHCTGVWVGVGQHSAGITEVGDNVVGYEDTCL